MKVHFRGASHCLLSELSRKHFTYNDLEKKAVGFTKTFDVRGFSSNDKKVSHFCLPCNLEFSTLDAIKIFISAWKLQQHYVMTIWFQLLPFTVIFSAYDAPFLNYIPYLDMPICTHACVVKILLSLLIFVIQFLIIHNVGKNLRWSKSNL